MASSLRDITLNWLVFNLPGDCVNDLAAMCAKRKIDDYESGKNPCGRCINRNVCEKECTCGDCDQCSECKEYFWSLDNDEIGCHFCNRLMCHRCFPGSRAKCFQCKHRGCIASGSCHMYCLNCSSLNSFRCNCNAERLCKRCWKVGKSKCVACSIWLRSEDSLSIENETFCKRCAKEHQCQVCMRPIQIPLSARIVMTVLRDNSHTRMCDECKDKASHKRSKKSAE